MKGINYWWVLLWATTNYVVSIVSFYSGYFLMSIVAFILFPAIHYALLTIRFGIDKSAFWLLFYLLFPFSLLVVYFTQNIYLIVIVNILIGELLLYLISKKFGRFVFTGLSVAGLTVNHVLYQFDFMGDLSMINQLSITVIIISFFSGLGIEIHKWNIGFLKKNK